MNDVEILHKLVWRLCGVEWHLISGNKSVAKIIPAFDKNLQKYRWLSVIDHPDYPDHGWNAVDFETLDMAKYDIEQWWTHMCKGQAFRP